MFFFYRSWGPTGARLVGHNTPESGLNSETFGLVYSAMNPAGSGASYDDRDPAVGRAADTRNTDGLMLRKRGAATKQNRNVLYHQRICLSAMPPIADLSGRLSGPKVTTRGSQKPGPDQGSGARKPKPECCSGSERYLSQLPVLSRIGTSSEFRKCTAGVDSI